MKIICLIFVLFLAVIISLRAQNSTGGKENGNSGDKYPVMEGSGITIVGSRETTQQMEVIDRETIEKTHAPDIPSLLQESSGLGVTRYGPYGNMTAVNIRGFDTKRTAILVDGIPLNSTASGDFNFDSIDPASIERIEIIYGGSDTKFNVSGAMGGVINFVTVKKEKLGWSLGGGISNTSYVPGRYTKADGSGGNPQWQDFADTQRINLFGSYGTEKYSFRLNLSGNRAENHFLYQDYFGLARRKESNEILDGGASLSFIRELPEQSRLIATGAFYSGDKNIPDSGYAMTYRKQKDIYSRENVMLDMPRAFHDDLSMELSLGHNWKNTGFEPDSLHNENRLTLINRWSWYPVKEFTLRFGGDYTLIHLDSAKSGLHNGHRGGLYLSAEYAPVKKLLLIASVKGATDGKNLVPIPKLGLAWAINDNLTLKNNYFRSFKFPDFDDLYWVQAGFMGNLNLKNEDGWGADLGVELAVKELVTVNSTVYGEWTEDSIHWSNASGTWRPENISTAAFFGWDNRVKFIIPFSPGFLKKPIFRLSWQYQPSWLLTGNLSFNNNRRIPYLPLHTVGVSVELPWETSAGSLPGSLAISCRYESVRYGDTGNLKKLDPHILLNITYNQKVSNNLNFFGKINNALNTQYVSFADYPMPGISLTVGLRANWEVK